MAQELQSLLKKIHSEGIQKAEEEKEKILYAARTEASRIIREAREEAEKRAARAEEEAAALQERAAAAARQAARDILLQLKENLRKRLETAISGAGAQALTPEFMAALIRELAQKFASSPDSCIQVRTAVKDLAALDKALKGALAETFRQQPQLFAGERIAAGMEVSFSGDDCYFDFTLDAISDLLNSYVGEQLAAVFKEKEE